MEVPSYSTGWDVSHHPVERDRSFSLGIARPPGPGRLASGATPTVLGAVTDSSWDVLPSQTTLDATHRWEDGGRKSQLPVSALSPSSDSSQRGEERASIRPIRSRLRPPPLDAAQPPLEPPRSKYQDM